jgi:hypothetical protein
MRFLIVAMIVAWMPIVVRAQSCPQDNHLGDAAESSTLHGTLVHFDELREWLGVKLDHPACGEEIVGLVFTVRRAREVDAYRGCEVTVTGKLYEPATGYYSARLAMQNADVKAAPSCHPQAVQPDPLKVAVPADLTSYQVSIVVDFRGKGHTEATVWRAGSEREKLMPTAAYLTFGLNGSAELLHFSCRVGFAVRDVIQKPAADHEAIDEGVYETAMLKDLGGVNRVGFRCEKKSE